MKKANDKYYLYIIVTLAVVIFGIMLTSMIGQLKPNKTTDVRARASASTGLKINGTVAEVNPDSGSFTVTNAAFDESKAKLTGTWTVQYPTTFNAGTLSPGSGVLLTIDAQQFNIQAKTMTAIAVSRR
jgi:hypothetical protein